MTSPSDLIDRTVKRSVRARSRVVRVRRPIASLMAALAVLLLGFGLSNSALACQVTMATSVKSSQSPDRSRDNSAQKTCFTACGTMCQALVPDAQLTIHQDVAQPARFRHAVEAIESSKTGPDPPPPRIG